MTSRLSSSNLCVRSNYKSKMLFAAISVVFLPLVFGAADPTKVCAPDQVSFYSYDIITDIISFVALDYKQKLMGVIAGNVSIVNDLSAAKSYVTDGHGHCSSSDLPARNLYPQCLPAEAVHVGDISVGIGDDQIIASGWQFAYASGSVKVAFTDEANQPNFPILSRFVDDKGVVSASFYFDIVANITKPDILVIPSPCPPSVIV